MKNTKIRHTKKRKNNMRPKHLNLLTIETNIERMFCIHFFVFVVDTNPEFVFFK